MIHEIHIIVSRIASTDIFFSRSLLHNNTHYCKCVFWRFKYSQLPYTGPQNGDCLWPPRLNPVQSGLCGHFPSLPRPGSIAKAWRLAGISGTT